MDIAYKLGAGRYIQMPGAVEVIGEETARYGKQIYVLGGPTAISILQDTLKSQYDLQLLKYDIEVYNGYTSWNAARTYAGRAEEKNADVIVGVGGGRIMDLAKASAHIAGLPVVLIPTCSATCAAYTPMSVMYEDDGRALGTAGGNFYHDYEVSAVIIDEDIMVHQPPRYAAAGMLDSMAKCIEMCNGHPQVKADSMNFELYTAYTLSEYIYKILKKNYSTIYHDIENHILSKEVHDYLYINFALTGFISGSSKALGQTALAHEMYYAVRKFFTKEAAGFLHGEIVGMALLLQLVYNRQEDLTDEFSDFMKATGMPTSLEEIGICGNEKTQELIYRYLLETEFVTDTQDNREYLKLAIQKICRR